MRRVSFVRARFEFMRMPATAAIALTEPRGPFEAEVRMDREGKSWQAFLFANAPEAAPWRQKARDARVGVPCGGRAFPHAD